MMGTPADDFVMAGGLIAGLLLLAIGAAFVNWIGRLRKKRQAP